MTLENQQNYWVLTLVSMGVDGLQKFVELEPASRILKSALPHRSEYIETHGLQGFHHLLDELEEKIFSELQKMLAGQEADESDIRRATDVRAKLEEYRSLKDKQQLPPTLTQ